MTDKAPARITLTVNGPGARPSLLGSTMPPVVQIDMSDTVLADSDGELFGVITACAERLLAAMGIAPHERVTFAELEHEPNIVVHDELHVWPNTDGPGYSAAEVAALDELRTERDDAKIADAPTAAHAEAHAEDDTDTYTDR